jgi:mannitol-specific phosphotransferase system IIBC component
MALKPLGPAATEPVSAVKELVPALISIKLLPLAAVVRVPMSVLLIN